MISVRNIYYMLSYAFKSLRQTQFSKIATEEFDNALELLSEILIRAVRSQLKRGLVANYLNVDDKLSVIKGKIDFSETLNSKALLDKKVICTFDDYTSNIMLNRVIKSTLLMLMKSKLSRERKGQVRSLMMYFSQIDEIDLKTFNWNIKYNKHNQVYEMIVNVCKMLVKGLILTQKTGDLKVESFIDEQQMHNLYERFVFEYYKQEYPNLKVDASHIKWDVEESSSLLPQMKSDITLQLANKVLIIDTKYYQNSMQSYQGTKKFHSSNLYQIFAYVKNKASDKQFINTDVAGLLLYAKANNIEFNESFKMGGKLYRCDDSRFKLSV